VVATTQALVGPLTVYVPDGSWDGKSTPGSGYYATGDVEEDAALVASGLAYADSLPEGTTGSLHPADEAPVTTPLSITATNASSAELAVRVGESFVVGQNGTVSFALAEGHHELQVGGAGFQAQTLAVDVTSGEPVSLDIELVALENPSGMLTVVDEASGESLADARVFVQPSGIELPSSGSGTFAFDTIPAAFELRAEGHASTFFGPFLDPGSASGIELKGEMLPLEPRLYGEWFTCYYEDAKTGTRMDVENPTVTRTFNSDGTCTVPDRPRYWRLAGNAEGDVVTPVYRHDQFAANDIYSFVPIAFFDNYVFDDAETLRFSTTAGAPTVYEFLRQDCGDSTPDPEPSNPCTPVCNKMVEACAAGEDHDNALEDCTADCPAARTDFVDDGGTAEAFGAILACCAERSYPSDCSADFADDCVKACSN
jgi:hypothetical protein